MKKIALSSLFLSFLLLLSGCGSQEIELPSTSDSFFSLGETYTIGTQKTIEKNVYGIVLGDNLKVVTSTVGGLLTHLSCQPGDTVTADTIIARITPNQDDPTIKGLYLQQTSLTQQLQNLQDTYLLTQQNFAVQRQTLYAQIKNTQTTYDQDNADIKRIEDSIGNFKQQQKNTIIDALKKIHDAGGKAKNTNLYDDVYDERNEVEDMENDDFSEYLEDMADLSRKAATYASGDTLSASFVSLSNGFRTSKSSFDTLVASLSSAKNAYTNQRNTLSLTLDFADEQLQTLKNNEKIQLHTLDNQLQTLKQSLASLSLSLAGETVYAGVAGTVKAKLVGGEDNKIAPSTPICQIAPSGVTNKKIQIYSAEAIPLGQVVTLFRGDDLIGAAKIEYELPYRDTLTQNYIYEISHVTLKPTFDMIEGDRLSVEFYKTFVPTDVWIPIGFVFSKLDGNYVRIASGTGFVETKVVLGDINGDFVKVLSGANLGQVLVN